jgi:stringent starvation protein B
MYKHILSGFSPLFSLSNLRSLRCVEVFVSDLSTRPYLIRAIYEWCVDSGLTPYLAVRVDEHTEVPRAHVKDGEIVLNLSTDAVRNLLMGNEMITCTGRFGGAAFDLMVPVIAVIGIFAKETGQGLVFQGDGPQSPPPSSSGGVEAPKPKSSRPQLKIVK